jgi:hypothetical protein
MVTAPQIWGAVHCVPKLHVEAHLLTASVDEDYERIAATCGSVPGVPGWVMTR